MASGSDSFVSAHRKYVKGFWVATACTFSSFRTSELNVPFNKNKKLTLLLSVSLNETLRCINQHRDHSCAIGEAGNGLREAVHVFPAWRVMPGSVILPGTCKGCSQET